MVYSKHKALTLLPGAGAVDLGVIDSPIAGADGNREFLLAFRKEPIPA